MIDKTKNEIDAITHAGMMGGEFIDSIKVYDLTKLTVEQYNTFVECVVTGYQNHLSRLSPIKESELPF